MRPAFGENLAELPPKSQLVIEEQGEGYLVLLAVCGENRVDLEGTKEGILVTLSSNVCNQTAVSDLALVYGQGQDPYGLTEEAVSYGLALTGKGLRLRRDKKFPEIFEKIGWCTWDSLGQSVSEKAVFEKMEEFKEKGIPIPWVLIDDGWSCAEREKQTLTGLDADPDKFPDGIKGTVRALKERFHVEWVGVWQAIKGYWNGVEEGTEAYREMRQYLMRYPNGELMMRPETEAAFGFWNRWHSYLKQAGVDFIKVDSQSSFSIACRGRYGYAEAARAIHTGLEASADLNFGGNLINCMGMAPEDIWNRQSAALSRNSDDYTPTVPGSFGEHVLQNCYNSVYHGCFYWGDWDMVWSRHEDVKPSMMIRALSGGPVYLSDGAGTTDPEEVWPVILKDGTILRCQDVARPTLDCLVDGGRRKNGLLKLYNQCKETVYAAAVSVGETKETLTGQLMASDFPFEIGETFWVYNWKRQEAQLCGKNTVYDFTLAHRDAELFLLIPRKHKLEVVGMTDKYIAGAAAEWYNEGSDCCVAVLKCDGDFGFLTQSRVKAVTEENRPVSFIQKGDLYMVPQVGAGHVLRIELESFATSPQQTGRE